MFPFDKDSIDVMYLLHDGWRMTMEWWCISKVSGLHLIRYLFWWNILTWETLHLDHSPCSQADLLVHKWKSFQLVTWNKIDHTLLEDFLNYNYATYLKQRVSLSQSKIIAAYHTSYHRLAIEIGRWPTTPLPRVNKLCLSFSYGIFPLSQYDCPYSLLFPSQNDCPGI